MINKTNILPISEADKTLEKQLKNNHDFIIKGNTKYMNLIIIKGKNVINEDVQVLLDSKMTDFVRLG